MSKYSQIDLKAVRRYSIKERYSKVHRENLGEVYQKGDSFLQWFDALPRILVASDLHEFVDRIVAARRTEKPVIFMMGAHVIKVGLSPIVIDLMQNGILTCIAMNGAGIVHDTELSLFGQTSEEVADGLADGTFGMARETGEFINKTIFEGHKAGLGLGEAIGKNLLETASNEADRSVLATAYKLDIPATIHVAIGTDIIHQHPDADGEAIGGTSFRDFKIFTAQVAELNQGGVAINFGSNVIMPEVFLKALTIARNVRDEVTDFYTANFDMFHHYRPRVNVVQRPTLTGGKGYNFIGHHEIMLPLLAATVKEKLA
jgi:deoxyhypusine synthase